MIGVATIAIVAAQDSRTANVEVRVWQSTSDAESLYISARPEGGDWGTLGTIPLDMSGLNSRETYRYGDITVAVPLAEVVIATPTPIPVPTPSATYPVIHWDPKASDASGLGFIRASIRGDDFAWVAREARDGSVFTVIDVFDNRHWSSQSKLRVACISGKLYVEFYPNDFLLVRNDRTARDHNPFSGDVIFQVDDHGSRSQRWSNVALEGSLSPILKLRAPEQFLAELRGSSEIFFFGGKGRHGSRATFFSVVALLGSPVQWNIDNCGNY